MQLARIGIHQSVDTVFPAAKLAEHLADIDPAVAVVSSPEEAAACDGLVTLAYDPAFLEVRWIHSIQAGVDRFPQDEFREHEVVLTNSTGIHGDSIGETVAGYMLGFARWLHRAAKQQPDHAWDRPAWDETFTLDGETVCVVGLGTLGRGIADRATGLGMRVTGVKRTVEPVEGVDPVYPADDLADAIADARFVVLALPLTDGTRGLIGRPELKCMRQDAYLINVARGPIVDTGALVEAITTGEIRGAALDVFDEEPLPGDSPLWDLDEVVITPHIAGLSRDYYRNVAELVRENLDRLTDGSPLTNRVI